jgi:hypothetical protein
MESTSGDDDDKSFAARSSHHDVASSVHDAAAATERVRNVIESTSRNVPAEIIAAKIAAARGTSGFNAEEYRSDAKIPQTIDPIKSKVSKLFSEKASSPEEGKAL